MLSHKELLQFPHSRNTRSTSLDSMAGRDYAGNAYHGICGMSLISGTIQKIDTGALQVLEDFAEGGIAGCIHWSDSLGKSTSESLASIASRTRAWDINGLNFTAVNDAARRAETESPHLQRILSGSLAYLDARKGASIPTRIVLAQDHETYTVARAMSLYGLDTSAHDALASASASERIAMMTGKLDGLAIQNPAAQTVNWIVVSPEVSQQLISSQPEQGTQALLHELEHLVSLPKLSELAGRMDDLEEGIVHALALAPAAQHEFSLATGIVVTGNANPKILKEQVHAIETLLALAGHSLDTPVNLEHSRDLLQGAALPEIPDRISRAIAARHRLSDVDARKIADVIRSNPLDVGNVTKIIEH